MLNQNGRLTRIEDVIRARRDTLIARLCDVLQQQLSEADFDALIPALERDIAHGAEAVYTPAELAAIAAFDDLVTRRPDVADIMRALIGDGYVNN